MNRAKKEAVYKTASFLVRVVGLEPTRLTAQEPKSCVSTNSTIPAYSVSPYFYSGRGYPRRSVTLNPQLYRIQKCYYLCLCSILSDMLPSLLIFLVALTVDPSGCSKVLVTRAVCFPAQVSILLGWPPGSVGNLFFPIS